MIDPEYTCYPVLWAEVSALLKTRNKAYVAICGYSGRICKVESHRNILPVMIITVVPGFLVSQK
jgi:hypothetical protein